MGEGLRFGRESSRLGRLREEELGRRLRKRRLRLRREGVGLLLEGS